MRKVPLTDEDRLMTDAETIEILRDADRTPVAAVRDEARAGPSDDMHVWTRDERLSIAVVTKRAGRAVARTSSTRGSLGVAGTRAFGVGTTNDREGTTRRNASSRGFESAAPLDPEMVSMLPDAHSDDEMGC
jgi:hypothetical protein